MRLALVLVLVLGCKTDETPKPAPSKQTTLAPTQPSTPDPATEPAPTKSQQALAQRMAVLSKVAVTAKKHQGDCKGLADAIPALADSIRTTASLRADLDASDGAIEHGQMAQALAIVLSAGRGCETAGLDPLTDQLSDSASSK